jgi:hypothetical protein
MRNIRSGGLGLGTSKAGRQSDEVLALQGMLAD